MNHKHESHGATGGVCCSMRWMTFGLIAALGVGATLAATAADARDAADRTTHTATPTAAEAPIDFTAPGLTKDKPDDGAPFVEIEGGYMVPYTTALPGYPTVKIEMVPVPGGTFMMGAPQAEREKFKTDRVDTDAEGPQFEVQVDPFWIARYETTWDQWHPFRVLNARLKEAQAISADLDDVDAISFPTKIWEQDAIPIIEKLGYTGYPASSMTQLAAKQYTKWMTAMTGQFYRLPSAAEWEYAARAGTTTAFPWGDEIDGIDDRAVYFDNSAYDDDRGDKRYGAGYRKVGSKGAPNPWGLHDMHGNVAEWVLDAYDKDHYKQFEGKKVSWQETINWPTQWFPRELRGGHWNADAEECRSAARIATTREWAEDNPQEPKSTWYHTEFWIGFRVIRPLHAPASITEREPYWKVRSDEVIDIVKGHEKNIRVKPDHPVVQKGIDDEPKP